MCGVISGVLKLSKREGATMASTYKHRTYTSCLAIHATTGVIRWGSRYTIISVVVPSLNKESVAGCLGTYVSRYVCMHV